MRTQNVLFFSIVMQWVMTGTAGAQTGTASPLPSPPMVANPTFGSNSLNGLLRNTPHEFWLTCLEMIFGISVLFLFLWSTKNIPGKRTEDVSRTLIVITVITASLILITAGFSNDQIAPAFGLFGTIVGYMLGRMNSSNSPHEREEEIQTSGEAK